MPLARERGGEAALEEAHLAVAADERRESPLARHVEARPQAPRAAELVDAEVPLLSLDREAAEILELEEPRDQRPGHLGQVDLARLGERLHPGREPDRVPLRGIVHPEIVADASDHDLS